MVDKLSSASWWTEQDISDRFELIKLLGGKMNFEYKLAELRRKKGLTQEELADKMGVTRQSVSKWESGQSLPDLEKIIKLSELFEVTTDYLIKDENNRFTNNFNNEVLKRQISLEEAKDYLKVKKTTARYNAFATFLCIISPITLILLAAFSEVKEFSLTENVAAGIGLITTLLLVGIAVAIFVRSSSKLEEFNYIEKETFKLGFAVKDMVKERKDKYKSRFDQLRILGIFLCIVAAIPLFIGMIINDENDLLMVSMVAVTIFIVANGVFLLVLSYSIWDGFEKLISEGAFNKKNEKDDPVLGAYWALVTLVFLFYSIITKNWRYSWLIFLAGGLLQPLVHIISKGRKKEE